MGSPPGELGRGSNEAQASVTLTRSFWIAETEVTQAQWKAASGGVNPSYFVGDSRPVERVSWWSVFGYLNALSVAEGLTACFILPTSGCTGTWQAGTLACGDDMPTLVGGNYHACTGYRLPTEAEWEYAARAGTTTATYGGDLTSTTACVTLTGAGEFAGDTALAVLGWYSCNNSPNATKDVRGKAANSWGLHDMLGNVWEWAWDRDSSTSGTAGTDPQRTTNGTSRVIRGGYWGAVASSLRAAGRGSGSPDVRSSTIGFRVARTVP
jgi:sulfatase modifying factor 1